MSRVQRMAYWFARRWLAVVLLIVFLYVGLPFAAPALMYAGAEAPARAIYLLYRPLCHQFAFRSWFLFGAQAAYPLKQVAGMPYEDSFQAYVVNEPGFRALYAAAEEQLSGEPWTPEMVTEEVLQPLTPAMQLAARDFIGSPTMGYKLALCERDIAIYGAVLVGGLLFARVRRRLRPAPFLLYLVLGLGPIALDGGSQLLATPPLSLWPMRETYPHFRALTGALFGLMNVWLAFPYLEASMTEMRLEMAHRMAEARAYYARRDAARDRLAAFMAMDADDADEPPA